MRNAVVFALAYACPSSPFLSLQTAKICLKISIHYFTVN